MFLKEIVGRKKEEVKLKQSKRYLNEIKSKLARRNEPQAFQSFYKTLSRTDHFPTQTKIHLIAEIKKASPSKGILREEFNPVEISRIYEEGGVSAISVLTEEFFFQGSLSILEKVRNEVRLPLLRKDFIVHEIQIEESKAFGADAILLIAAVLEKNQAYDYFLQAKDLGLDVLVEVHTEKELEKVIEWSTMIGINNRDLTTFEVDQRTTKRLMKYIPRDRVIVSESGVSHYEDLFPLIEEKVNAVLIGEAFMKEMDISSVLNKWFPRKEA